MRRTRRAKRDKVLELATVIALVFGAYFLRHFFSLIVFAVIVALLFNPLYLRFSRKYKKKTAATMTLMVSLLILIIPIVLILLAAVYQIKNGLDSIASSGPIDIGQLGQQFVDWINRIISHIPGVGTITVQQLQDAISKIATDVAKAFLSIITASVSGISSFITSAIIYLYVFINILVHQDSLIELIKRLNPLGRDRTGVYLKTMASMTKAMVKGQFLIALLQGFTDALLLYIAGLKGVFIFMFLVLTILSIIPLGGGIVAIPIGIVLLLSGHIWQGLLVLLGHFTIVTNIDNVLRPRLVPKEIYLNPALTLLGVFAGIAMFGFLGIVLGPVIMILIVSTLQMYIEATTKAK
jgi:predicted PurR-regulated permease PerM